MPLQLRRKMAAAKYYLKCCQHSKSDFPILAETESGSRNMPSSFIERIKKTSAVIQSQAMAIEKKKKEALPPWRLRIPMLNSTSKDKKSAEEEINRKWKDHLWIYTDGAKSTKGKNGAAFVIPGKSIVKSERIAGNLTATTCELIAIHMAMKWIQDDKASKRYAIFSDSKSSLKEICSAAEDRSSLVRSIQNIWLAEKAEKDIEFIWIPSHSGILGNEEADRQAKAAFRKETTISVRKTYREQLHILEE